MDKKRKAKIVETDEERKAREKREFFDARAVEAAERKKKKDETISPPYGMMYKKNHYGKG